MNKKTSNIIIVIAYAIITLLCILNHELTTDEIQVWQLCKNLNLNELIRQLHNEGHPGFFYIITMPFAKIFTDIIYMQIICWLTTIGGVYILLEYAPFRWYSKLSIILSAGFLYYLPVVARSYSIIPLLVFLSAILYERRKRNPILYGVILMLLANTHIIMLGFVGMLFLMFLMDIIREKLYTKKENIIAGIIIFAGIIIVVMQLYDTTTSNNFVHYKFDNIAGNIQTVVLKFFINSYKYSNIVKDEERIYIWDIVTILVMVINFILLFKDLYKKDKKIYYSILLGILFQIMVYILTYPYLMYVNRIFCAYTIIIFGCWVVKQSKELNIMLSIMFMLTINNGIQSYIEDIKENKQSEKEAANFIRKNIERNSIILTDNEQHSIRLVYYLKGEYKVISVIRDKELKYIIWDEKAIQKITESEWEDGIIYYGKKYPKVKDIYIVRYLDRNKNESKLYKSIYETKEGEYRIYKSR